MINNVIGEIKKQIDSNDIEKLVELFKLALDIHSYSMSYLMNIILNPFNKKFKNVPVRFPGLIPRATDTLCLEYTITINPINDSFTLIIDRKSVV